MNKVKKSVPDQLTRLVVDESIKSRHGKSFKGIFKDTAEVCKSISDPDKFV